MEYLPYKAITENEKVIWLCGKQSQLTMFVLNELKHKLAPFYFNEKGQVVNHKDNVIVLNNNTSSAHLEDLFKEPPFLGDYYFLIGDYSDLDNKVKRKLLNLLETPPNHIISVVYISQYRDYRTLADNKHFNIGKAIYLFRTPRELYHDYARNYIGCEISDKALNSYIKRTDNYENFILYLDKLSTLTPPITSDMIKKHVPDCSSYTMYDYLRTLIVRDKKTIHMKALQTCLETYKRKTFDEIIDNLEILINLKRLTLQGYILPYTIKEDLTYLEEHHLLPKVLEKLSAYKINKYLEVTSVISLSELNLVYLCFLNTKPSTQNLYILTDLIYNRNETKQLLGSICNRTLRLD